ncbi:MULTISPECIES: hypothetical protein [unclassified Caballeronia]|uniref:hypothetical protein n=1 Tax=unclassified Caballeronia TaxID=2646786 RepID=UPI0028637A96|nr:MULTISPECIES: hypothetical protein [unclassified Caballeronia]MDR5813907.1 hypothetical protein [Caballeronia sp. LZ033]MDR5878451.1 hypothetical protein [Caballeronia sp. LZ032]
MLLHRVVLRGYNGLRSTGFRPIPVFCAPPDAPLRYRMIGPHGFNPAGGVFFIIPGKTAIFSRSIARQRRTSAGSIKGGGNA